MGLENNLTDVSSESIPIMVVALIGTYVGYLRTLLFTLFQILGLSRLDPEGIDEGLFDAVGSGLAGLIVLSEQLNLNRVFSYRFGGEDDRTGSDCVVCLNQLGEGDHVRKLACRHVFHKKCLDGWLDQLKFSCPLCRSSLVSEECVSFTQKRVSDDVLTWFSMR
ncbi:unnamed protein product [Ilex paraguariensis]|uniref:RING-type domain-containing protein n=1 Tax=Ilex paraguariensis TaxID=185542 RepID=A0ABC8TTW4_9AQUA